MAGPQIFWGRYIMMELLTLTVLSIIALFIFRKSAVKPLENPLVINRIGQFHAVLAPRLNLAQPLLEAISRELGTDLRQSGNSAPLYFSLQDQEVKAHGKDHFLLAATLRDGVLYLQAAAPEEGRDDLDTIRAFAATELAHHAETGRHSDVAEQALQQAIRDAAAKRGTTLVRLGG